ncbi:hypothetical protein FQR65_LT20566 [Abscondita terminalis]|nr:hypothetical protein FQR65_LT20566 [Abscondita terminalis]
MKPARSWPASVVGDVTASACAQGECAAPAALADRVARRPARLNAIPGKPRAPSESDSSCGRCRSACPAVSSTYARSATPQAWFAIMLPPADVSPSSRNWRIAAKCPARQRRQASDGSSRHSRRGSLIQRARHGSICCSPAGPACRPAGRGVRARRGNSGIAAIHAGGRGGAVMAAARSRQQQVVLERLVGNTPRPSGTAPGPRPRGCAQLVISPIRKVMRPSCAGSSPATALSSVLLPAPLAPMMVTISPARISSDLRRRHRLDGAVGHPQRFKFQHDHQQGNAAGRADARQQAAQFRRFPADSGGRPARRAAARGLGRQRARQFHTALQAIGQASRGLSARCDNPTLVDQLPGAHARQPFLFARAGQRQQRSPEAVLHPAVAAQQHVVEHGQVAEQTQVLEAAAHAQRADRVRARAGDIGAAVADHAAVGHDHAAQHVDERALARAVGAISACT